MLVTADRALLGGLVDYAGLFPPAQLGMKEAVDEYREAREGPHAWMLGRFLVPASRLEELAGVLMASMRAAEPAWGISVILDGQAASAAVAARSFDAEMDPAATVTMVEVRLADVACAAPDPVSAAHEMAPTVNAALSVSPTAMPFFEIVRVDGWRTGIPAAVGALASHRERERRPLGAKLRCGGLDPAAFPSIPQIVAFMTACREADVPFKATAGLHHPVRHRDDELGVFRHGFLNLVAAAALCEEGADDGVLAAVLEETDELAFRVSPAALRWHDVTITARAVQALRTGRFASYGSCSFQEPVEGLAALGIVGPA